jgi:hypothetical protein
MTISTESKHRRTIAAKFRCSIVVKFGCPIQGHRLALSGDFRCPGTSGYDTQQSTRDNRQLLLDSDPRFAKRPRASAAKEDSTAFQRWVDVENDPESHGDGTCLFSEQTIMCRRLKSAQDFYFCLPRTGVLG